MKYHESVVKNTILFMGKQDKGSHYKRTKMKDEQGKREKAFFIEWRKANKPVSFINYGYGVLQDLFLDRTGNFFIHCETKITPRDRYLVATVMQWLGTNCGWCFLGECLKRMGYKIVKSNDQKGQSR